MPNLLAFLLHEIITTLLFILFVFNLVILNDLCYVIYDKLWDEKTVERVSNETQ